jgi:hypothetical protein
VRRLRDENAVLHARLANAAKENSEVTWNCDALLRKLNGIKQPKLPTYTASTVFDARNRDRRVVRVFAFGSSSNAAHAQDVQGALGRTDREPCAVPTHLFGAHPAS